MDQYQTNENLCFQLENAINAGDYNGALQYAQILMQYDVRVQVSASQFSLPNVYTPQSPITSANSPHSSLSISSRSNQSPNQTILPNSNRGVMETSIQRQRQTIAKPKRPIPEEQYNSIKKRLIELNFTPRDVTRALEKYSNFQEALDYLQKGEN